MEGICRVCRRTVRFGSNGLSFMHRGGSTEVLGKCPGSFTTKLPDGEHISEVRYSQLMDSIKAEEYDTGA